MEAAMETAPLFVQVTLVVVLLFSAGLVLLAMLEDRRAENRAMKRAGGSGVDGEASELQVRAGATQPRHLAAGSRPGPTSRVA